MLLSGMLVIVAVILESLKVGNSALIVGLLGIWLTTVFGFIGIVGALNLESILTQRIEILNEHTKILNEHTKILSKHTEILNNHTSILTEHTEVLKEIKDILKEG